MLVPDDKTGFATAPLGFGGKRSFVSRLRGSGTLFVDEWLYSETLLLEFDFG